MLDTVIGAYTNLCNRSLNVWRQYDIFITLLLSHASSTLPCWIFVFAVYSMQSVQAWFPCACACCMGSTHVDACWECVPVFPFMCACLAVYHALCCIEYIYMLCMELLILYGGHIKQWQCQLQGDHPLLICPNPFPMPRECSPVYQFVCACLAA